MIARWLALIALLCVPQITAAQAKAPQRPSAAAGQPAKGITQQQPVKGDPQQQPGMVITGDREAPLVLHIVPWQEPKPVLPRELSRQALIPDVLDYAPSVLEAPENRPLGKPPAVVR
jgi:hypothetical protein